jgi:uncharacterized protein YjdB
MVRRRSSLLLMSAALVGLALSCSKPAKVVITPKMVVLHDLNASKVLNVQVLDAKDRGMDKVKLTYSSSAPEVAEVDNTGKVTAKGSGDAIITASTEKVSGSMEVRVRIVASITLKAPDDGAVGPPNTIVPIAVKGLNERGEPADLEGIGFKSSAPEVAAVDAQGRLTLLSNGVVTIQASLGKASAEILIPVKIELPAAVKVESPIQNIKEGETQKLDFSVISDLGKPMTVPLHCESSAEKVATVDAQGNVTGVGRGSAVITITAGTASNTIKVVVH